MLDQYRRAKHKIQLKYAGIARLLDKSAVRKEKENKEMPVVSTKGVAIGFELTPDGTYKTVFTSYKNGTSNAGKPKATGIFTIQEPKAMEGKTIIIGWSFDPNALFGWKGDMVALGVDPDELEDERTNTDEVMDAILGTECVLVVTTRSYKDKATGQDRQSNDVRIIPEDAWEQALSV